MSLNEQLRADEAKFGSGKSATFKFRDGQNRFRLLTVPKGFQNTYENKTTGEKKVSTKYICRVIDRSDSTIKLAYFPLTIFKALCALESSEDFGFDGCPMPYDVTISVKRAGTTEVEYGALLPTSVSPLTEAEKAAMDLESPIDDVIERLKEKQN